MARPSSHPGVTLRHRRGRWYGRWRDPATGAQREAALGTRPAQARLAWARAKAAEIASSRRRGPGAPLFEVLGDYLPARGVLRQATLRRYGRVVDQLRSWAEEARVTSTLEVTRAALGTFRDYLVRRARPGRGALHTLNRDLATARMILAWLQGRGLLDVSGDDLRRVLHAERLPAGPRPDYLSAGEVRQLVAAALLLGAAASERVPFYLLSGLRWHEGAELTQDRVLGPGPTKIEIPNTRPSKPGRDVLLGPSPALRRLLAALRDRRPYVLGAEGGRVAWTVDAARGLLSGLRGSGAPARTTWLLLRHTCATFLTCAPGIYGAASAYQSAQQLGHSVRTAERHYLGRVTEIPVTAHTLEAALGVEDLLRKAPWWGQEDDHGTADVAAG